MPPGDRKRKWKGVNAAKVKKLKTFNKRVGELEEQMGRGVTEEEKFQLLQPSQQTLARREQTKKAKRNEGKFGTAKRSAPIAKERRMCRHGQPREANGNFGSYQNRPDRTTGTISPPGAGTSGYDENYKHDDDGSVDGQAL